MTPTAAYDQEERRAKKLRQVRGLLAKADRTKFPHEADTFRAKADELMAAFAISEFDVRQGSEDRRPEPVSRPVDIEWYFDAAPFRDSLWLLMQNTAYHCRVRLVYWKSSTNSRTGKEELPVVGMPADLDYFDMLFTHLWAQMGKGLEPKPDPDKQMIDNLIVMKEAGMKWERIGELLYAAGQLGEPYTRSMGVRFTKLYTDYCDQHNRSRLRTTPSVYQRSFAEGFVRGVNEQFTLQRRLSEPVPADKSLDQLVGRRSGSTAIALRDIRELAANKANELFGEPPKSRGYGRRDTRRFDESAYHTGKAEGVKANTQGAAARKGVGTARKELSR